MIVTLYIDGVQVDLYRDENITVTDSIQDVKEFDKVKTTFTRQFVIPASKTNNKIFAYYHDVKVQSSFDARFRTSGHINVNGVLYRKGSVRLLSATMKNNVASSYTVSFIGETVTIPDTFEDDELSNLDFSSFDHNYTEANARTGLQTSLSSGAIIYPLIYHTNRYVWTTQFEIAGSTTALNFRDLKPAIQLKEITDQIATQYGITWATGGFWDDTDFAKLFMWCHRDSGEVVGGGEEQTVEVPWSEWSYNSGDGDLTPMTSSVVYVAPNDITTIDFDVDFTVTPTGTGSGEPYSIEIIDEITGDRLTRLTNQTGVNTFSKTLGSGSSRTWEPKIIVSTTGGITAFTIDLDIEKRTIDTGAGTSNTENSDYNSTTGTFNLVNYIVVANQMPEMTIIDFITGLFKMFNLTSYVNSDGEIVVETLDTFYSNGTERDITKYIVTDTHKISRTVPYSQIEYKFSDPENVTAIEWNRRFGVEFGSLDYKDTDGKYDGDTYTVELPFEKMLYEAQFTTAAVQSEITSGVFLDKKFDPSIGAPLIFYAVSTSCSTNTIRWKDGAAVTNTTYNRPANVSSTGSINFGEEIDEHTLALETGSLFSDYHTSYISNVFDQFARVYNFTAVLPLSFITSYELNDTIIIGSIKYRISKIRINLNNGRSNLELVNIAI